ncbi:MAG TPA: sialidase family protein [Candidatus Dormibacteraeota bacterium]|nr:sialidase family protein [Candidatus Dormibacteraeota bacterium]
MNNGRRGVLALAGVASVVVAAIGFSPGTLAGSALGYNVSNVGAYGGEPSLVSDSLGQLYDTTPSGGLTYTSTNHGASWTPVATADSNSGDNCLATDQSNALYLCNLFIKEGTSILQTNVFKSTDHAQTWAQVASPQVPGCSSTSCNPFGVDRPWVAASIPSGTNTNNAEVVLMYHDFYGPSQIWVNISHDGGATFGGPQEVLASPAVTPGAVSGTLIAQGYTFCNTVPAGVAIAPPGTPHAGRIFVAWIAADLAQNATGCNITMTQSFHTLWTSYSDDGGATWTPQQAFDAGVGHDASTPFVGFTIDTQGNPYFGFANNLNSNPATCSAESTAGTVQSDFSCEYDMYVVWSSDGGASWDGGGGLVPGSAKTPYRVNAKAETGTHFFPAIAAGNPGEVDVAYLRSSEIVPTDPLGKTDPGGCAGPGPANGNPTTYPPACSWNLYAAQSLNLTAGPAAATWAVTQITTTPMHVGDICNLGIFCVAPASNRNLADFITEDLDQKGCAHIAYADDNTVNMLRAANQTSGTCIKK